MRAFFSTARRQAFSAAVSGAAGCSPFASGTEASSQSTARTAMRSYATGKKDYYDSLGVKRGCSLSEIKKAYRKKAMETHPDKPGGDKTKFAEVGEAYEVLSNEEKRKMYDQFGHEGYQAASQGGGHPGGPGGPGGFPGAGFGGNRSAEDIFAEFFGMGGRGGGAQRQRRTQDLQLKLSVTLEELYTGATKSIRATRPAICSGCKGEGTSKPGAKKQCHKCNGSGQEVIQQRMGPMIQQSVTTCRVCNGQGMKIKQEDLCTGCQGEGHRMSTDSISISIEPGMSEEEILVMPGEAGRIPGADPGDLHLHLSVMPHKVFTRKGNDLYVNSNISLGEALLGTEVPLTLLDGRKVTVVPPKDTVLSNGSIATVKSEGMMKRGKRGDLFVVFRVNAPRALTSEQKEALTKAFGTDVEKAKAAKHGGNQGKEMHAKLIHETEEQLNKRKERENEVDRDRQRRAQARQHFGGGGGGGEQVQCQQQ